MAKRQQAIMAKYHGTPIGGSRMDVATFLQDRDALVPYPRPDDLAIVLLVCRSFILDNGAYSFWKQGLPDYQDYDGYVAWVRGLRNHPKFQWAIIPDHIAGDEAANDVYLAKWPADLFDVGVPVFHMHHSLARAKRLAEQYPIVALGGSPHYPLQSKAWWARMAEILNVMCDETGRPKCKIHGLRMLNPKVFTRFPLASGDSVNAGRNSCKKNNRRPDATRGERARLIAEKIERYQAPAIWHHQPTQLAINF